MLPLDDDSAPVALSAMAGVGPTPVSADEDAGVASAPALPDPTPTPLQVVEYYHLDALGSVRAVTDAQGQVIARHDFLPFGEEVNAPAPPHDRKLFTGQERDFETALDYFHARQLRVDLGRFTAPDPLADLAWTDGRLGATNAYSYVQSNPLGFIDRRTTGVMEVIRAYTWRASPRVSLTSRETGAHSREQRRVRLSQSARRRSPGQRRRP